MIWETEQRKKKMLRVLPIEVKKKNAHAWTQRLKDPNMIFGQLPGVQPSGYVSPNNDSRRADSSSYKNPNNENDNNQLHILQNNVLVCQKTSEWSHIPPKHWIRSPRLWHQQPQGPPRDPILKELKTFQLAVQGLGNGIE